jgi:hypothetical protein
MKQHLASLLVFGLLASSCKKTVSPTQGELNAAEISKAIANTRISVVDVWNTDNNAIIDVGASISISSDGTANILTGNSTSTINLGLLKSWEVDNTANGYTLNLYY